MGLGRWDGDIDLDREDRQREMAHKKRKNLISDSLIMAEVFIKLPGGELWEDKTLEI